MSTVMDAQVRQGVVAVEGVFDPVVRRLLPRLQRLLAAGEPVALAGLAETAGVPVGLLRTHLARHPSVEWDDQGRIVGFGLTLRATAHRFVFAGRTVYGWCASDALTFPVLLDAAGVVESACAATGAPIRVEVTPGGVGRVEPPGAVVSRVRPAEAGDVRTEVCSLGNFFASPDAAKQWLQAYPQGRVVGVAEDFEVHRRVMAEVGWTRP